MDHALIVGGSGFIGQSIVRALVDLGWNISVFDIVPGKYENRNIKYYVLDVQSGKLPTLKHCSVIINVAGIPINNRFSNDYKKKIWSSRIITTRALRQWVESQSWQPRIYIGASAVGYYGNQTKESLVVSSKPGNDFLAQVCIDWEREHSAFSKLQIPVAIIRQGVVIGKCGYIQQLAKQYSYGFKIIPGNGKNFVPWIDIRDLVSLYLNLINGSIHPATFNAVSPVQVTFLDIARVLSLHTSAVIPIFIPSWILRLRFKEMSQVILANQRVTASSEIIPYITHTNLEESIVYSLNS